MEPLKHPDQFHLRAAEGWLELGDHREALTELNQIAPGSRIHPDVLEVKWQIYARAKKWERCIEIANALIRAVPERSSGWVHLSYALHETRMTEDAYDNLLSTADHFQHDPIVAYNLGCYACQMGRKAEAMDWIRRAMMAGGDRKIKAMALEDSDLEPLWKEIRKL
jgi:uncharacterized protein HemY